MARAQASRSVSSRFVPRIYCISIVRYADVPDAAGPFSGASIPVRGACNGVEFRGTLVPRGGGRLAFESWAPGRRRAVLAWLNDAKVADTRARRVRTILDRLGL